jgi:hypothetical protein
MTENTNISNLETLRAARVHERRRLMQTAFYLAAAQKAAVGVNWRREVMRQQELIEAISCGIADEQKLATTAAQK